MKKRVAKKILKNKDKLKYKQHQIATAEKKIKKDDDNQEKKSKQNWYIFPNFKGIAKKVNYEKWNGDMREHHK